MRTLMVILAVALLAVGPLGCQKKEGPAEKAGKQIDQAAKDAGAATKEAAEKAEKKLGEAADKLRGVAEKADPLNTALVGDDCLARAEGTFLAGAIGDNSHVLRQNHIKTRFFPIPKVPCSWL